MWFQRRQWTCPQCLRAENTAYFFKILIAYFIYLAVFLAFKFGWVVNNTFFCGVTNSEHTFNIDFTRTLRTMQTLQSSWTAQSRGASALHHLFSKVKHSQHTSPTVLSKGCLEWLLMGQSHLSLHCMLVPSVTNRSCESLEFSLF